MPTGVRLPVLLVRTRRKIVLLLMCSGAPPSLPRLTRKATVLPVLKGPLGSTTGGLPFTTWSESTITNESSESPLALTVLPVKISIPCRLALVKTVRAAPPSTRLAGTLTL